MIILFMMPPPGNTPHSENQFIGGGRALLDGQVREIP
jgi:hypothetical protein